MCDGFDSGFAGLEGSDSGFDDISFEELSVELDESGMDDITSVLDESGMDDITSVLDESGMDDITSVLDDLEKDDISVAMDHVTMDELPEEMGDLSESVNNMTEYLNEQGYGREDFETYSKDPQWQELNDAILAEMGQEPIEYGETVDQIEESEVQSVEDLMNNMETGDEFAFEDENERDSTAPESIESQKLLECLEDTSEETENATEDFKIPEEAEKAPETQGEPLDIEYNAEFTHDLLEKRPDLAEMFRQGEFFDQGHNEYGFEGTCGETTQANTLNRLLETTKITENDILKIAVDKNLCDVFEGDPAKSGGTTTDQFMQLYEELNHRTGDRLNVECFDYENALSMEDMAKRLDEGSVLNIAVDSYALWDEPREITDTSYATDHWISVTGVERNSSGEISGFKIVDSGDGRKYLDKDKFKQCYMGDDEYPLIDPTCIVVSKKGK